MGCFVGQRKLAVKISDFGLVKLVGEEWVRSQAQLSVQRSLSMGERATQGGRDEGTSTRSLLGTYEYLSPEQKRCEEADARSDLYSVGLMAFKLLTGRNPGTKPPSRIDPGLVPDWDEFIEQALEEDRAERLESASAGIKLLEVVAAELAGGKQDDHSKPERSALSCDCFALRAFLPFSFLPSGDPGGLE